jgi:hypothetical protein
MLGGPAIKNDLVAPPTSPRNNRQEKETAMSTRKVLALASVVAMLFASAAFGIDPLPDALDSPFYIVGEKTDSGLGDLSPSYTAAEFQTKMAQSGDPMPEALDSPHYVLGESRDSGLGDLSPSYTAARFQRYQVAGESLDSGLGALPASYTAAEFKKRELVAAR